MRLELRLEAAALVGAGAANPFSSTPPHHHSAAYSTQTTYLPLWMAPST